MRKLFTLLLLLCSTVVFSQVTTANISGKIKSKDGLVSHSSIKITFIPTSTKYSTSADERGIFHIYNANVGGPYVIYVTAIGYKPYENSGIYLSLGENNDLDILLEEDVKKLQEIVVTSKKNKDAALSISESKINAVPTLSRSITDFTKLVPQSVNNSFAGTNFRYNNVTIDGTISNDAIGFSPSLGGQAGTSGMPGSSTRTSTISIDAIKDIQVYIAPYDVKIGNFLGGSINAITRSGTNKVEGSIYAFGRNTNDIKDGQTGFRIGFPIVKDKLFFFTSGEITKRTEPVGYGSSNGLISDSISKKISDFTKNKYGFNVGKYGDYSIYSKSQKIFNRLDWNINNNNQLTIRNNITFSEASNLERDAANFRFGSMDFKQNNVQNSTVVELRSRIGKYSNSLILGYTNIHDYRNPLSDRISFPQTEISYNGGTIFIGNEREGTIFNLKQKTFEFTDNLSFSKGKHSFLIGTHNEFYKIDYGFVNSWNGRISYKSLDDYFNGRVNRVRGFYSYVNNDRDYLFNNPYASFNINLLSAYLQDEINFGKLKLSPGIRFDYTQLPNKPRLDSQVSKSFPNITNNYFNNLNFSPRIGFNYRVDKDLVIRGGSGIFVGRIPFAWLGYAYYNDGIGFGSFDLNNRSSVANIGDPILDGSKQFAFNNGQKNLAQTDLIKNDFKMPKIWRSNLAIDKTIKGYKLTLEGIYTKTINDLKFQQINIITDNPKYFSYDSLQQMPIYSGSKVNNNLSNAYLLSNTDKGYRYQLTASVNKKYKLGLDVYGAYTYGISKDITNGIRNSMESNWQLNQSLTPNDPQLAYSNFDIRHRIISMLTYKIKNTQISFVINSQSGTPFTWGIVNGTLANNPQAAGLAYIFKDITQAQKYITNVDGSQNFINFINDDKYLSTRKGEFTERNGGRTPWSTTVDTKITQDIKIKKIKFQITADIFNLTNLLNKNWGKTYFISNTFNSTSSIGLTRTNSGLSDPLFTFKKPTQLPYSIDPINSTYQFQVGLRFTF